MSKFCVFALMTAYSSGAYAREISRNQIDGSFLMTAIHVNAVRIAYILILLICGGIIYRQYRLMQRSSRLVNQKNQIITEKNELLDRLIKEKEWLLKEVHHRVKNNLHTILSLMESQSIFLENEAYKALEDSRSRVYAMSLIHRQLYRSEDISTIDMSIYLSEFVSHLQQSEVAPKIHFELNAPPIQLALSQAMPLALIINEAVTNSIKYAFPGKKSGEIKINLSGKDELIKLVIEDNGIGIDLDLLNTPLNSLGITLIKGLAEDIMGSLQFESNKGTRLTLSFNADYFYQPPVLG